MLDVIFGVADLSDIETTIGQVVLTFHGGPLDGRQNTCSCIPVGDEFAHYERAHGSKVRHVYVSDGPILATTTAMDMRYRMAVEI